MSNKKTYHSRVRYRRTKGGKTKCRILLISGVALFVLFICFVWSFFLKQGTKQTSKILPKLTIQTQLLKKNKYSRPGIPIEKVTGIVVHYTANPGTNAMDNRNYFNNLPKINQDAKSAVFASSHFVIGLEGQIVQCIPLDEIAYASNERNKDTIAIECCHPDKTGKFNKATYEALIELLSYLCIRFDLDEDDIIRHYDVTGKMCPLYYVKHEEQWEKLRKDVKSSRGK